MDLLRRWVARQFTTRVIVLMPVAIAINIVLGYTVQSGLKLPIYVDSIGTILVGVLGGPLPGMFTGALSNLIWQYAPGIGSGSQIGPFAITAAVIGLLAGVICLWGVNGLKRLLGADDSLDVFGVHGVGGILGSLLTGVFCAPSLGGTGIYDYVANKTADSYSIMDQLIIQATGVGVTIVWSGLVAFICYKLVDMFIGLRVAEDEEREGLDIASHGEAAYHYN